MLQCKHKCKLFTFSGISRAPAMLNTVAPPASTSVNLIGKQQYDTIFKTASSDFNNTQLRPSASSDFNNTQLRPFASSDFNNTQLRPSASSDFNNTQLRPFAHLDKQIHFKYMQLTTAYRLQFGKPFSFLMSFYILCLQWAYIIVSF